MLGLGLAQAAPLSGVNATSDESEQSGGGQAPGAAGSDALTISTGNRNVDRLLAPRTADTAPPTGTAGAAPGKEPGAAASTPALREATLRQAMRAEAALQAEAKAAKRGDSRPAESGMGESELRGDADSADPTAGRRWDATASLPAGGLARPATPGEDSEALQAVRDLADYLRSHRVELFAVIGLLLVLAALLKVYMRRS